MENCLFDFPTYSVNKKIRLIELFGGIGSQAMALRDIGADFEHYKLVEFDKYAVASYNAIHNTQHTTHDIRQVHAKDLEITDKDKYCYLMTYSFPCTDLSVAGKMQGMSKEDWQNGNSTRSGLLWEVERILKEMTKEELPDILLMENVPQVHAEKNSIDFENWLRFLRSKGYQNYWQDINAKDLGIPQNRERTFCISILSDEYVDFEFPKTLKLDSAMRDFLEDEVEERYYLNNPKAHELIKDLILDGKLPEEGGGVSQLQENRADRNRSCENPMCERLQGVRNGMGHNEWCPSKKNDQLNYVGNVRGGATPQGYAGSVYQSSGLTPTILARDYKEPILILSTKP